MDAELPRWVNRAALAFLVLALTLFFFGCQEEITSVSRDAVFHNYVEMVLEHEGGYVDRLDDSGGPTNYGITLATLVEFRHSPLLNKRDLLMMDREEAIEIYRQKYWAQCCLRLPAGIDYLMFDMSINHGLTGARRLFKLAGAQEPYTEQMLVDVSVQRARRYIHLNRPQFIRGWLRRTIRVASEAVALFRGTNVLLRPVTRDTLVP